MHSFECIFYIQLLLVGNVGKKCHLASSLDSYGELSLVKSAGAGNAAGKNLCSLGDELSELGNVLVINFGYLVLAEDANLLSSVHRTEGTLRIISFHFVSPKPFRLTISILLLNAVSLAKEGRDFFFLYIRREDPRR